MPSSAEKTAAFIERWSGVQSSEKSNAQSFLAELCDVLEVCCDFPQEGKDVSEILKTLAALGRAHKGDGEGTYLR